jgi:hypothetical protein
MPLAFNNPQHWHKRAVEARSIADGMTDIEARGRMLIIAAEYENLAARATARLKARWDVHRWT